MVTASPLPVPTAPRTSTTSVAPPCLSQRQRSKHNRANPERERRGGRSTPSLAEMPACRQARQDRRALRVRLISDTPMRYLLSCAALFIALPLFAADPPKGFTPLFNGKDLSGWHGWA